MARARWISAPRAGEFRDRLRRAEVLTRVAAADPETFSTPELRVDCADDRKFEVVACIADEFAKTNEVITIDGARIIFEHGWGLVRASNTQAILVLRFEADSKENLEKIREIVETRVSEILR